MPGAEGALETRRLRLVPIGPGNADDLWLVHADPSVAPWYDGWRPSLDEARAAADRFDEAWRLHGVHKWIAYDRRSGRAVGRGGRSRTPVDDDWGQGYATEIGRAGLAYAFGVLGARAVVSCTVRHNVRSRAVMDRLGMGHAGEIVSRGTVEGEDEVRDDAPFAVHVALAPRP